MEAGLDLPAALHQLTHATGVVFPVYFHPDTDPDFASALLAATVQMFEREVADPQTLCLSVDGGGFSLPIAERVAATYGVQVVSTARNHGKLAGLRHGVAHLLANPHLRYVAVADCDGDHFGNELLNFVRCAEQVRQATGSEQILVLGSRASRHRPLGWLRAEQEELANRLLLDALHYHAVRNDQPLPLQFTSALDDLPDFHSGYKLFSRATAMQVFLGEPQLAGCAEDAYYRHGCEAVMTVEALLAGAPLAEINRRAFDEQPISSFARLDRAKLAADMIVWPCKRLGVPGHFVAQWLTNHLPRLLLGTLVPQGRSELFAICKYVLTAFDQPVPADEIARPLFV